MLNLIRIFTLYLENHDCHCKYAETSNKNGEC